MEMEPVQSSNIAAVGYDGEEKTLTVEFKNGRTYRYLDVEPETYEALHAAPSVGRYFQQSIRGNFAFEQV